MLSFQRRRHRQQQEIGADFILNDLHHGRVKPFWWKKIETSDYEIGWIDRRQLDSCSSLIVLLRIGWAEN